MTLLPEARIIHTMPGRTRLKISSCKKQQAYFSRLLETMTQFPDLLRIEANPLTGSVLLEYDGEWNRVSRFTQKNNLFQIVEKQNPFDFSAKKESGYLKELDRRAREITVKEQGFSKIVILSLIGLSCYQISRGNFKAPAWYTTLWYAYNIHRRNREQEMKSSNRESRAEDDAENISAGTADILPEK
ncbi:MAG: hypothetical protein U9R66_07805 [Thermodesulfobacteriota bacterium]|nr:hypothetical protein [Thermodesulfobacteriota bacterium]